MLAAAFDQTPWRVAVRRAANRHIETQSRSQRGSHNRHRQSELGHKCLGCETYLLVASFKVMNSRRFTRPLDPNWGLCIRTKFNIVADMRIIGPDSRQRGWRLDVVSLRRTFTSTGAHDVGLSRRSHRRRSSAIQLWSRWLFFSQEPRDWSAIGTANCVGIVTDDCFCLGEII
jgi:hypothetical protein